MRGGFILLMLCLMLCFSSVGFTQSFEVGVSGGQSEFVGNTSLGTVTADPASGEYKIKDGFRLTIRLTLNQGRFLGHEFGYSHSFTSVDVPAITTTTGLLGATTTPAQNVGVGINQGFYDFLFYPTPEGTRVRPFVAGGVQFSSFAAPGTSVYYGNQPTKYGFNYGGGMKVRFSTYWGVRFDVRWYNSGKPFDFPNQTGRLQQLEIGGGLTFNL